MGSQYQNTHVRITWGKICKKYYIYENTKKSPKKIYIVIYRMCMCCMSKTKKPKTVKKAAKRAKK